MQKLITTIAATAALIIAVLGTSAGLPSAAADYPPGPGHTSAAADYPPGPGQPAADFPPGPNRAAAAYPPGPTGEVVGLDI
jgi:hypothetical protein